MIKIELVIVFSYVPCNSMPFIYLLIDVVKVCALDRFSAKPSKLKVEVSGYIFDVRVFITLPYKC
jgi:hypothetical protein